ncbi:MAG: thiamine pyrophosphate-binding protein [Acetobacteraceae bacterium]|nr:thiamine pyrophosphate-binding protein [Acetobacteraceae bacterium]
MRVYQAIVKGLESIGVTHAFGGAGENAASLMLALKHSSKIRAIITRHEQAASFMACGYAMYTNRLGFCFATAGPGAFNLFSGLAVAMSDSYPVLAVTGFSALAWQGKGALNETSGRSRTPNSQTMFSATTKGSFLLTDASETCDLLENAVNLALAGRPGPVHIHVPEDLTHPDISVENYRDICLTMDQIHPDPASVAAAANALRVALREGKRIVALAGFGAIQSGVAPALTDLLDQLQIPLVTTLDGKGVLPENHPLVFGLFCDSGHSTAWKLFREADVVLAIGNSFAQHATFNFRPDLLNNKTLIHINIDPGEIDKVYRADHAIVSDAKPAIESLAAALRDASPPTGPLPVKHQYDSERITHLTGKIHPGQMVQAISRRLPEGSFVLADAGTHAAWLGYYLQLRKGQRFRKPGSFGPMAGHINGAIGLKCAYPDRHVIVGCGDGGYLLSGFELMTAVQYSIPVIWIIFNDGEFKLIKLYQLMAYDEAGLVEFTNPDYAAYARACGALGYRVQTLTDFEEVFESALKSSRPTLIDAAITRLALPHYSPSPEGVVAGLVETLEQRL